MAESAVIFRSNEPVPEYVPIEVVAITLASVALVPYAKPESVLPPVSPPVSVMVAKSCAVLGVKLSAELVVRMGSLTLDAGLSATANACLAVWLVRELVASITPVEPEPGPFH